MAIVYKMNVVEALKDTGYSSYRIRKEKIMGEATLQKLRDEELVSWETVNLLCRLLKCQPGDLLEYLSDE